MKRKRGVVVENYKGPWKKRSIFYELPYWQHILLRHNLDVMHIEKNVTKSLVGTLLGMDKKNKDSYAARLDLVEMNINSNWHPQTVGGRTELPHLPLTLSNNEKRVLASVRYLTTLDQTLLDVSESQNRNL